MNKHTEFLVPNKGVYEALLKLWPIIFVIGFWDIENCVNTEKYKIAIFSLKLVQQINGYLGYSAKENLFETCSIQYLYFNWLN